MRELTADDGKPQAVGSSAPDGFYIVNCPNAFSPNTKFDVVISLLQAKSPCSMLVGVEGPGLDVGKQTVTLEPMSTKLLAFEIPDMLPNDGEFHLRVQGTEGVIFTDSAKLYMRPIQPAVYVQTDRATYKPGDLVQFRVLFLDDHLRPADIAGKAIRVYITDPETNRIRQFDVRGEQLSHGVFREQLQLSDYGTLGMWWIMVELNDIELSRKSFKVDRYVLPSFEVSVRAPKKVCILQDKFTLTVQAKYTYGKPVKGSARVTIKPSQDYYWGEDDDSGGKHAVEKSLPIDGKASVEFGLDVYRSLSLYSGGIDFEVEAAVSDELSGKEQKGVATFTLVEKDFEIITPQVRETFLEGSPAAQSNYEVTIKVVDLLDQPVRNEMHSVRVLQEYRNRVVSGPLDVKLNVDGEAKVQLPWQSGLSYNIRIEYRQYIENGTLHIDIKKPEQFLTGIQLRTNELKAGDVMDVEFKGDDSYDKCLYTVVSHGRIRKSQLIDVGDRERNWTSFLFDCTHDMIPSGQLYVQYISGSTYRCYEATFRLAKEFSNEIVITAPEESQPGDDVALSLKADAGSFVGLLAVDESVLLQGRGNDLDGPGMWARLEQSLYVNDSTVFLGRVDNTLVTITNAQPLAGKDAVDDEFRFRRCLKKKKCCLRSIRKVKGDRVRRNFLETWFFDDLHMESASMELTKVIPDSITSWVVTGFAVHPNTGFALTKEPTKIKTFRPFFMVTNLPYSIKRGEIVTIPIVVFNYSEDPVTAEVALAANDEEFDGKSDLTLTVEIPAGGGETVNFVIQPKKVGHVTLKVTACSQRYSDAVEKELKVEPEGLVVHHNHDLFFDTKSDQSALQKSLKLEIPDTIVPDSEHIEVSVMGDILGSTISNLDKLVRMPCGCGEQNMVNFVPNILVLDYLISTHHLTKTIEETAKRHLNIGYQRELTYKHDDGSYSAFGKTDKSGSTWLTAYVVRSFLQAAKYIEIDPKIVAEGVKFLHGQQEADGSFKELGKLFDFTHLDAFGLTAFVLIALIDHLNSAEGDKDWSFVDQGLEYLKQNVGKSESSHAVAMAVYALNLRHPGSSDHLKLLEPCLKSEGGHKWWTSFPKDETKPKEEAKSGRPWICIRPKNYDIEITSYVLMTMMAAPSDTEQSLPIIKWLISKRNSNGGFSTTQDTVVALQALIQFAKKINSSIGEFEVAVSDAASGVACGKLHINRNNSLVVQSLELPRNVRDVKYDIRGDGSGLQQIAYRYNIAAKTEGPAFEVSLKAKRESAGLLKLTALVKYLLSSPSNMVVMEISLPSGYKAAAEQFSDIEGSAVKRVETQNEDTKVIVYFESFSEGFNHSLDLSAARAHVVSAQKPSLVKLYDYYDNAKETTSFYEIEA